MRTLHPAAPFERDQHRSRSRRRSTASAMVRVRSTMIPRTYPKREIVVVRARARARHDHGPDIATRPVSNWSEARHPDAG